MLLDPFEEQLDLPTVLVQGCDGQRWQCHVVGQKDQHLSRLRVLELDAPQVLGVVLAGVVPNLIPLALQVAAGRRPHLQVFGRDYDTPDGTCVRDYVHVQDLCAAHWLALQSLMGGAGSQQFNLGNGRGFSVQEVIDAVKRVTGRPLALMDQPRRWGDPARLVADPALAQRVLGWQAQFTDLDILIAHAWRWENRKC
jgi:UDP-glucose 4-epimerase